MTDVPMTDVNAPPPYRNLDRYMSFWNWLEENTDWIQIEGGGDIDENSDKIGNEFEKHFPNLNWEIEITDEGPWFFIVSADGDLEKFGEVVATYQEAPQMKDWVVLPFRQPGSLDFEVNVAGNTLRYDDIWCEIEVVELEEHLGIELTLLVRGFTDENEDELADAAYLLLDNAVGEFDAATRICEVAFAPLEGDPEESNDFFPLSELPDFIERLSEMEAEGDAEFEEGDFDDEEETAEGDGK